MVEKPTVPGIGAFITERIEVVIPSQWEYVDPVVSYLTDHLTRLGYLDPDSNTNTALHEAITNAIRHGNQMDANRKVEIVMNLDQNQAVFTITDEGSGFDPSEVCDPTEGENLFRNCGRGLLLIRHLMDEVKYNERGNQITMIKKNPRMRAS
ncbi:MAG: ATP-binding protein [Acidobacteria bacterium]|nr:ATP-binding protein [Acidobacteriota bacterium]